MNTINDKDLEKVTGGAKNDDSTRCKNCSSIVGSHYWKATYKYIQGRNHVSRTVPICDSCYPELLGNEAYSDWKEVNS